MNASVKNKSYFLLVILLLLLSNCAQPPENPVSNEPTSYAVPISTSITSGSFTLPTLTPPPTSTKQPLLSETTVVTLPTTKSPAVESNILGGLSSPPYLVYIKKIDDKEQVVLVNQDGSGIKSIPLPENGFNAGNPSPTGDWLVFYTGSGGEQTLMDGPKYDLALNLMHLPDGKIHKVTNLLSKDFPDNLEKLAEMAKSNDSEISMMNTTDIVFGMRQYLIYRLMISQWSPSGEVLAFVGEMDGPSTDLYLYKPNTGNIQRLSSGSKNIDFIRWFPNGDQIMYSSSYLPCEGDCSTYYVTNLNGSKSREIKNFETYGGGTFMENWSGNSTLTMFTRANVIGTCCLRNFDFETDQLNILYEGSFENYAYDPHTDLLAISIKDSLENLLGIPPTSETKTVDPGTYFIDKNGMRKVEEAGSVYYLGWQNYPFIVSANGTKLLSPSGESKMLAQGELAPFASRSNRYVALCDSTWSQNTNGLRVFDNNENLVLEIKDQKIIKVIWRIDSQGLFYVTDHQLYYIGIQDKTSVLIDSHLNDNEFDTENSLAFSWVR